MNFPAPARLDDEELKRAFNRVAGSETTEEFRRQRDLLDHVADYPEKRGSVTDRVAAVLRDRRELGSQARMRMLNDLPVGPSDVDAAALNALEALADHGVSELGDSDVVEDLAKAYTSDATAHGRVAGLLVASSVHADRITVDRHVLRAFRDQRRTGGEVAAVATLAVGRLLALGTASDGDCCAFLERASEDGDDESRFAAIEAAGVGLAGQDPPIERLRSFLDPDSVDDSFAGDAETVHQVRAMAGAHALGGGTDARELAAAVFEDLWGGPPEIRLLVPSALERSLAGGFGSGSLARHVPPGFVPEAVADERVAQLDRALDDENADVQRAGVEAAEVALDHAALTATPTWTARAVVEAKAKLDRERPPNPYVELIHRAVTECDVPARTAAIDAYGTVAEHRDRFDIDDEFISERIRESLTAPDPDQRGSALRVAGQLLSENNLEDPLGDGGQESVEERGEVLAEDTSPTDLPERFERASTDRERAAVVEAARIHLDGFGLDPSELDALRETVRTAWDAEAPAIRRRAIGAIEAGSEYANLHPEFVCQTIDEGRRNPNQQIRARAVESLGTLLEADVLTWGKMESWTYEAITDDSPTVRAAAFDALFHGIMSSDVRGSRIVRKIKAIDGNHPDVIENGLRCAGAGLYNDVLKWSGIADFLWDGLDHIDPEIATEAVTAVGAGLQEGTVEWGKVREFFQEGLNHVDLKVATEAVTVVGAGLGMGMVEWGEVREFFQEGLNHVDPKVATEAVTVVGAGLQEGTVEWGEVSEFLRESLNHPNSKVATEAVTVVGAGHGRGMVEWGEVVEFLQKCLAHPNPEAVIEAVAAVGAGLQEGTVEWGEVREFLIESLNHADPEVATEAVRAVGVGLQEGTVAWEAVAEFLEIARESDDSSVAEMAVRAVGTCLQEGTVEWGEVRGFLIESLNHADPEVATEAVRAVGVGLQDGMVEWPEVAEFLEIARESEDTTVAEESVRAVGVGLQDGMVEWQEVTEFLKTARESDDTPVAEVAVRAVGVGLQNRTVEWREVADFLRAARQADEVPVAEMAVEAVGHGLQEGNVEWQEVGEFLEAARQADQVLVAEEAVTAVGAGLGKGTVEWGKVREFLRECLAHYDAKIAIKAVEAIGVGLQNGTVEWGEVRKFLWKGLTHHDPEIVTEAVTAVGLGLLEGVFDSLRLHRRRSDPHSVREGLNQGSAEWGEVIEFLSAALDDDNTEVAVRAVETVRAGLQKGAVNWSEVSEFISEGLDHADPSVVTESVRAIALVLPQRQVSKERATDVFSGEFSDCPIGIRRSIVLMLSDSSPPYYMIDTYLPVLNTLLDDPNGGIRQLVTQGIVGDLVEHSNGYESDLLDTLTTVATDDDRGVQRRGVGLVGDAIDSLGYPAVCRAVLVDVATDETNHSDVRTDALELLGDTVDRFDSHGPLVSALETATAAEADTVRREAVRGSAQVLADVGARADRTETLQTIVRRGLSDDSDTVRESAAVAIASLSADIRPDLAGDVRRLQEVLAARELPAAVRIELIQIVSQYDVPVRPLGDRLTGLPPVDK